MTYLTMSVFVMDKEQRVGIGIVANRQIQYRKMSHLWVPPWISLQHPHHAQSQRHALSNTEHNMIYDEAFRL